VVGKAVSASATQCRRTLRASATGVNSQTGTNLGSVVTGDWADTLNKNLQALAGNG